MFLFGRLVWKQSEISASKKIEREDAREAARRFTRGNIAIQQKAFLTTDDLEAEREEARRYSFK